MNIFSGNLNIKGYACLLACLLASRLLLASSSDASDLPIVSGKPFIVLVGDSIAEGHPSLHGRLHPHEPTVWNAAKAWLDLGHTSNRLNPTGYVKYDKDYPSKPGQLSYEFSKRWGIPVLNQAIGGQTSDEVRKRWPRDVLGQSVDVRDGRGERTFPFSGQKPLAVYLHVGINDIRKDVPAARIKDNFLFFAQSSRDNNIVLIADNIGSDNNARLSIAARQERVAEINNWLAIEFKARFPEVHVVDYLDWSSGGTKNLTTLRQGMFADDVHPNRTGYVDYANYVARKLRLPIFQGQPQLNKLGTH